MKKYDIFTFAFIPITTLLLASLGGWRETNLSVLGNQTGRQLVFALWGLSAGLYYSAYLHHLFALASYKKRGGRRLTALAAVFLLLAVTTPYLPAQYPLRSRIHVLLAFFSPVLLLLGLIAFLRFLTPRNPGKCRPAWYILLLMGIISCFFLLKEGFITSGLEVFLILSLCGYLRYIEGLLEVLPDEETMPQAEDRKPSA